MADDKVGLLALAELRKHPERYRGDPGKDGRDGIEGKAALAALTWRGSFKFGETYQPGDVVESDGSTYVALVVTARKPPDPDWDLLAAKGADGASGRGYIRGGGGSGSAGSALAVKDEGVSLDAAVTSIDVVGATLTATNVGHAVTITGTGVANPMTEDLLMGGFGLEGADDGPRAGGAFYAQDADTDGGGQAYMQGGLDPAVGSGGAVFAQNASSDSERAGRVDLTTGSANVGDNDGGDLRVTLGLGSGTGRDGQMIFENFPTSDPAVTHATFLDSGHWAQSGATPLGTAAFTASGAYDAAGAAAAAQAASQPLDSDLTAFAGLAIAADKLPYGTGSHTLGLADLTAAGRAILDDADAAAQLATLGAMSQAQVLARGLGC